MAYGGKECNVIWVTSKRATHFTTALADGAIESESISFDQNSPYVWNQNAGSRAMRQYIIRQVCLTVVDTNSLATGWRVWFWKSSDYDQFAPNGVDSDNFLDVLDFATAEGRTITGIANTNFFADQDLNMYYFDADPMSPLYDRPRLHVSLQPTGGTKAVFAAGVDEVALRVALEAL